MKLFKMNKRINTHEDDTASFQDDLVVYFKRPVVYFCFGVPLFVPSLFLILIGTLEDLSPVFTALGAIFLFLSVGSMVMGGILGVEDRRRTNRSKEIISRLENGRHRHHHHRSGPGGSRGSKASPTQQQSQVSLTITNGTASPSSSGINSSPSASSGYSSSNNSNNSKNTKGSVNILSNTDKTKLIKLKKKSARRKRGVKFPNTTLPSLEEEDSIVKSSCGNYTNNTNNQEQHGDGARNAPKSGGARRQCGVIAGERNMEEFQEYLSAIGLRGDKLAEAGEGHQLTLLTGGTGGDSDTQRTCKSFDERELTREKLSVHQRATPLTSRDLPVSPRCDYPRIVTTSHERTGVRMPDVR